MRKLVYCGNIAPGGNIARGAGRKKLGLRLGLKGGVRAK